MFLLDVTCMEGVVFNEKIPQIVSLLINLIKVGVPVLLIIFGMLDLGKAVMAGEEKEIKDVLSANTLYLSKQNGKYGFVDKNGVVIVDYIYDDATEQNEYGYAGVKKDGRWGAIDSTGKVIVNPTYTLSQNTVVSFIARWHLAPDLNANYYTDENE